MEGNCFDAYLSHCTPFQLPAPWDCVPPDKYAYHGPADPAAALAALLQAGISAQALLEAGIAQPNAAGDLEIHPFLAAPEAPIIALRHESSRRVNNLMTESGCITGFQYPVFAALLDDHCYHAIQGFCNELFLTGDIEDAIILRSLGFAAAPILGLSQLDDYGLNLLARLYGIDRSSSEHGNDSKCRPPKRSPSEETELRRTYPQHEIWVLPMSAHRGNIEDVHETLSIVNWSPRALSPGGLASIRTTM